MMVEALFGLGGNVGNVRRALRHAVETFCDGEQVKLLARSADYRTPPWGITDQPPFTNLCIAVETELEPSALLERALAIEEAAGRNRAEGHTWGPRPLDIDLLTYGDLTVDHPWLVVPHPRALERAFVLVPLMEIRPDAVINGVRIADAVKRLDTSGIERLPQTATADA